MARRQLDYGQSPSDSPPVTLKKLPQARLQSLSDMGEFRIKI